MTPTGAQVKKCSHIVHPLEYFIACPADCPACAQNVQDSDHQLGNDTKDDVLLFDEAFVDRRLRAVQVTFDDSPSQSMQKRLEKYDATSPAVEKVEVLIRDSGDQREDRLSSGKNDSERCQGVSHGSNTICKASEACSSVVDSRMSLDWSNPGFVDDSNEPGYTREQKFVRSGISTVSRKDQKVGR